MRRAAHSCEIFRRLRWCIAQELFPANMHIHKAPGDDSRFAVTRYPMSQHALTCTSLTACVLGSMAFLRGTPTAPSIQQDSWNVAQKICISMRPTRSQSMARI